MISLILFNQFFGNYDFSNLFTHLIFVDVSFFFFVYVLILSFFWTMYVCAWILKNVYE